MAITLTKQDQRNLTEHYPKLNLSFVRKCIWGTLDIACSFDKVRQELVYDDSASDYLCDSYEIRIDFNELDTFGFPKVYEESGIMRQFAKADDLEMEDFHINEDNSCCLGIFPEYKWQDAAAYICKKVIPFFYWQSYRRIYGEEPWKGYAHGKEGIKQAMTLPPSKSSKGTSRNKTCPCGSGSKYKKCCMERDVILAKKQVEHR